MPVLPYLGTVALRPTTSEAALGGLISMPIFESALPLTFFVFSTCQNGIVRSFCSLSLTLKVPRILSHYGIQMAIHCSWSPIILVKTKRIDDTQVSYLFSDSANSA